jgi:hypothetical protein
MQYLLMIHSAEDAMAKMSKSENEKVLAAYGA